MSILPSFLATEAQRQQPTATQRELVEYGIDYSTGQLTGRLVRGVEALKVWVWLCLHTQRYRYPLYTWSYGADIEQYIGEALPDDFLADDLREEINAALCVHPRITGVEDFSYTREGSRAVVRFRVANTVGADIEEVMDFDIS